MTDEQPWHGLTEAARLTGLDREAIRSRARRGLVPSRKSNRGELLVQIPAELLTEDDQGNDRASAGELTTLRAAMADLSAEVTEVRTALARAETELSGAKAVAAAEVAAVKAEVSAKEQVIAELREQLAWHRRPWWRRAIGH